MTPSLIGRIETRWFLLATVGVVVTAIITPILYYLVLGGGGAMSGLGEAYKATYLALALVAGFGFFWELFWHFLQQFRWEKDWPAMFILLEAIPEAVPVWFALVAIMGWGDAVTTSLRIFFILDFAIVWICVFLAAHGPMRVPFIRWRFAGGRLV
jgi:hypothetical protein